MAFATFQLRRATLTDWSAANPIIKEGELVLEIGSNQFKVGDGGTPYLNLPYGGIAGERGQDGAEGPRGLDGWEPVLAIQSDGERRVMRLVDWIGGEGMKPAIPTDNYIGSMGFTNLAGATDIRGGQGVQGVQGVQGFDGWEPILAVQSDGERRVLRLVDWTGGGGTKPAVPTNNYLGSTGLTNLAGATDIRGPIGQTGAAGSNGVTSFNGRAGAVTPQQGDYDAFFTTPAEAAAAAPVQSFNGRTGSITPEQADYDAFFTTPAEAAAAAPVQSVNGQTGNVTVAAGTDNKAVTRNAPTASASTALTTIQSYPVAAGEITAGSEYEFFASLRVINTTAASNAVVTLSVGATNVLVLTQAIGTTAAAAPGAAIDVYGRITFYSATQAEAIIRASKQAAVAFDAVANTAATVTVAAAGATTIDLKFNTSAATSTFIARQVTIQRVK